MGLGGVRGAGRGVVRLCTSGTILNEVHRCFENGAQHFVKNSYRGAQVRSAGCGVRGGLAPRPLAALAPRAVLTWAFRRACAPLAGAGPGRPHAQNERDGAGVQQGPYPNGAPGVRYTTKHSSGRAPVPCIFGAARAAVGKKVPLWRIPFWHWSFVQAILNAAWLLERRLNGIGPRSAATLSEGLRRFRPQRH